MSLLSVENLVKTYGEKVLFDHISFSISEKERIGLIGINGTGKTSLLKVVAGIEAADQGAVIHANQFQIEYLSQTPLLDEDLTVLEQIYYGDSKIMQALRDYEKATVSLEQDPTNTTKQQQLLLMQQRMDQLNAWEASTTAKTILNRLGIQDYNQPVKELSGGQRKRVALAKALIQPADLLILDEPTNHLDNEIIEWLETYLMQYRGAILLVTHDRYFLNRVTTRILELDQGNLYSYDGNYEIFLEKKAEREESAAASEDKRQNLLRRELAWLQRGAKARTTKQKARIQRAEELQESKIDIAQEKVEMAIGSTRLGKKVIELKEVDKSYEGKQLIHHFNYLVVPGERLGIIGPNGSGKTTLLNIMAGMLSPDHGVVDIGETVKIGYYTQDHQEMNQELRVIDYIKDVAHVIKTIDGQWITAEQMLERFLFSRAAQWTYIRKLSGGEKRRLYLLQVLMGEPNVLFLDEPTNDLDTATLSILEDYLDQFPGVVITVSHDRYFLDRVVDHLITFDGLGNIGRYQGNYSEYLEIKKLGKIKENELEAKNKANPNTKANTNTNASTNNSSSKEKRKKLSYQEQREWDGIEEKIATLEQRLEQIQTGIVEAASNVGRVQQLFKEQQETEEELEKVIERWTELSLILEEIEQNKG